MSDDKQVELKQDALDIVDSWLGESTGTEEKPKQPVFDARARRLGLGAKYVPHKREQEPPSVLKKKLLREKRRRKEKNMEDRDTSSESDSDEDKMSKAKSIKSKMPLGVPPKSSQPVNPKKKNWREIPSLKMEVYRVERKLGSGTFGSVFLVRAKSDGKAYALKQIRVNRDDIVEGVIAASRESTINKALLAGCNDKTRQYFVNMKEQFYTERRGLKGTSVWNNIVLEYVGSTLSHHILHSPSLPKDILIPQIINEVAYLHSLHIMHRDIKPSNILLLEKPSMQAKLCDFGCSKQIVGSIENHRSTPLVTSRFYRAPELLMGATRYGFAIDIWSLGCVIAEILVGTPLFIALDSDADQLLSIINILGTPSEEDLAQMQVPRSNREVLSSIQPITRIPLSTLLPRDVSPEYRSMLEAIFCYDPSKRPTASEMLSYCHCMCLLGKNGREKLAVGSSL
ncbi:hypothetical protein WA577_002257 [Blastocystis sp. JDR]